MTLPGGVFAETYAEDRALIRTSGQWTWFLLLVAGLVLLPAFASGRIIAIANVIGITLVAVIGLQITSGYAGQINMGQSAFMGVGGYAVGALASKLGMPFWLTLPLAGIGAALFGAVFGLAALRIKGFYLALTTIAAQYIFTFAMLKLPKEWFGRAEGLRLEPASLGGFAFDTDTRIYFLILAVSAIMTAGAFGRRGHRHQRVLLQGAGVLHRRFLRRHRRPHLGLPLGRRAADSGDRSGADGQAPPRAAGRAFARSRAHHRRRDFSLVERLRDQEGIAFLVVEQNAKVALGIADHGYVMENGRIVLFGSGKELRENEDIKEFYLGMSLSG